VNAEDPEQGVPEDEGQGATPTPPADDQIKRITPKTFSQKFYQSHELEIAEEFEQALAANSLERIKELLDKILELGGEDNS